ncbi:unnamed protein product, partial [Rotaria magnacalcarata]
MASKQELDKKQLEEQVRLKKVDNSHLEEEYEYVTEPPDGGFGWVIAIAAM